MKYLLLIFIKLYWFIVPASRRNHCIFKKSCSNHVFEQTQKLGLIEGLKALWYRYKNCRPGYKLMTVDNDILLITRQNEVFTESEIDSRIL